MLRGAGLPFRDGTVGIACVEIGAPVRWLGGTGHDGAVDFPIRRGKFTPPDDARLSCAIHGITWRVAVDANHREGLDGHDECARDAHGREGREKSRVGYRLIR